MIVPRQLPPAIGGFVGRRGELEELSALLAGKDGRHPAVVISAVAGGPGVGKTALAVQWAHSVAASFPDAALYVDLRGNRQGGPVTADEALDEAWILYSRGLAYRDRHHHDEGLSLLDGALRLSRAAGYQWGELAALHKMADTYTRQERWHHAERALTESLAIADATKEGWGRGYLLYTLADVYRHTHRLPQALDCLHQALNIFRDTHPDRRGEGAALGGLGGVYLLLGRCDEAIEYHRQALAASRRAGHRYGEMFALHNLGESQFQAGYTEDAYRTFCTALAMFGELGGARAEHIRHRVRTIEAEQGQDQDQDA
ncbi:ATP-binding protein [Actinomadura soli]|uniref:ATP-binding protein n=1 Tax=Actinomadura soli TaxID=2508997 RepID=A0A5C4JCS6_9ACTN|nr:tetratricopeptide repeat protein [Actinomadura soli]TMR00845.1 ATP-binding protein [Actinomadura soli]